MRYQVLFTALLLGSTACGSDDGDGDGAAGSGGSGTGGTNAGDCSKPGADDPIGVGSQKAGENGNLTIELVESDPAPPALHDNRWAIAISGGSGSITGATVTAGTWMPEHGHPSPKTVDVEELGGGEYELFPVNLFMPGLWEVTVDVSSTSGDDTATFQFCMSP